MNNDIIAGLLSVFAFGPLLGIAAGISLGIIFGAIPGLAGIMAVAILLPATFYVDPIIGISMLLGIYKAGTYGGSISAILINTPGAAPAFMTSKDGYPLAQKGQAGKALNIALTASVLGDTLSSLLLILVAAPLSIIALKAGPIERLFLLIFALTVVGSVSGSYVLKGILSCLGGLFLATVGISSITGTSRFTFGTTELTSGISFIPLLIGVLVMPEIIKAIRNKDEISQKMNFAKSSNPMDNKLTWSEFRPLIKTILKSTAIGSVVGALPGIGGSTAAFLAYGEAKRSSKNPEKFGHGALEGVAAPEAANNAVCGSAMIPMLTLGIPGDDVVAILMGAFLIQGITPGPTIFFEHTRVVYGIYTSLIICNVFLYIIAKSGFRFWIRLSNAPKNLVFACVTVFTVVGAYSVNQRMFDLLILFVFMLIGYAMNELGFNPAAFVIGFILSPFVEENLDQAITLVDHNVLLFFTKPFAWVFIALSFLSVWSTVKQKKRIAKILGNEVAK
jgi:putative tricarboxylic transport membrane protein